MKAGRKPLYDSPEQMQKLIDKYFKDTTVPTVCGLAVALGMNSRQTLLNYQGKEEFLDTVTRAKLKIEAFTESQLFKEKGSISGVQFSLENNFGWKTTVHNKHEGIPEGPKIILSSEGVKQYDETKQQENDKNI